MNVNFLTFKKTFFLFSPYIFKNKASRKCFAFATVLIIVDVLASSLVPYFSKEIVDLLSINITNSVGIILLLLGFFWILEKTINHIQEIIFFPVVNATIRDLTFDVVQHIHAIPLPEYQKLSMPTVINCIRRISMSARAFIKILFLMIVPTVIKLSVALFVTIKMGVFGYILLPVIILAGFILYQGTQWYVNIREAAWQTTDRVIMRMSDSILNTKITRFFNHLEMQEVGDFLKTEATLWQKNNVRLHTIHIMIGVLFGLSFAIILYGAILGIQSKILTVGDFVLLKGQLLAAFLPLKSFSIEFRQLAESLIDIKKIINIFEIPIDNEKNLLSPISSTFSTLRSHAVLSVQNISFAHTKEKMLFQNLSFEVGSREKLAIVGESGSGKTSLINLMISLYKPTQGCITLFDQDLMNIEKTKLSKLIHCIPQDLRLFNTSLRHNITYGMPTVQEELLVHVADQVGLLELIAALPYGFDTSVGEMGANLSGGEKQKVALARAILLAPQILLMDETTNSLHAEHENRILKMLFSIIPTVILATHRASTLSLVDRVLKIENRNLVPIDIQTNLRDSKLEAFNFKPESELWVPTF